MRKELAVNHSPLSGYLEEAYPLTIALSNECSYEWIYSNYIQLLFQNPDCFSNQPVKFFKLSFINGEIWNAECPLLCYDKINRNMLLNMNVDVIQFICEAINQNYYVKINLDEYYLPYRKVYHKTHFVHESLFYGFDDELKELYGLSYVTDEKGYHFKEFTVNMEDVRNAYQIESVLGVQQEKIVMISCNRERFYEFDLDVVKKGIYEYINSVPTDIRYSEVNNPAINVSFGLSIYEKLYEYLQQDRQKTVIPLHIIHEHKQLMLDRIMYMIDNQYIDYNQELIEQYKVIIDKTYMCKMLFLKYIYTKSDSINKKLLDCLIEIRDMDEKLMNSLYDYIQTNSKNRKQECIYSRWGWWRDVAFPLKERFETVADISFKVNIINKKSKGYIRLTNSKCLGFYFAPFILRLDANKGEFGIADRNDANYVTLSGIDCEANQSYIVTFHVDLGKRQYSIRITNRDKMVTYENEYDNEVGEYLTHLDYFVAIHENSYRYSISDICLNNNH